MATDMVAVMLPVVVVVVAAALGVVAAATRRSAPLAAMASVLAVGALAIAGPWRPIDGAAPRNGIRVVGANVLDNSSGGTVVADILAQRPDVLVVTELGEVVDTPLRAAYEEAERSRTQPKEIEGSVGLYSRWPVDAGPLPDALADQRGLRAVIEGPDGPFVVYALHLAKPTFSPHGPVEATFSAHRRLVDRLRQAVRQEALPTLVIGDLNLVDRTSGYRAMRDDMDDAMRASWVGPTSFRSIMVPLLARIDHVFMPTSWCSADSLTFSLPRSDHRGVAVTVGPC